MTDSEKAHFPTMEEVLADHPHLLKQWEDANGTCMQHQCTPDYEMGQHHGQLATMQVCRQRNGTCQMSERRPIIRELLESECVNCGYKEWGPGSVHDRGQYHG